MLNNKSSQVRNNRNPYASMLTYNLPTLIKKMKHTPSWEVGELNSMIILNNHDKQIVLTVLHEGTQIISFQSCDSLTFQIIEGKMKFQTRKETMMLEKGQLMTLQEKTRFRLTSLEESVFLLTILVGSKRSSEN